jgi:hypothetical protein
MWQNIEHNLKFNNNHFFINSKKYDFIGIEKNQIACHCNWHWTKQKPDTWCAKKKRDNTQIIIK